MIVTLLLKSSSQIFFFLKELLKSIFFSLDLTIFFFKKQILKKGSFDLYLAYFFLKNSEKKPFSDVVLFTSNFFFIKRIKE